MLNVRRFIIISLLFTQLSISAEIKYPWPNIIINTFDMLPKLVLPFFAITSYGQLCPIGKSLLHYAGVKHVIAIPIANKVFHYMAVFTFCNAIQISSDSSIKKSKLFGKNTADSLTHGMIYAGGQMVSEAFFSYCLGTLSPITGGIIFGTGFLQMYQMHLLQNR